MARLSRDEAASIVIIGVTVAVLAWYRTDITGVGRWTNAAIAFAVSIVFATAATAVLKRWNPVWYRS